MLHFFGKPEESDLQLRSRQLVACISILSTSLQAGVSAGYSAVLLPQLRSNSTENDAFRDLTSDDLSWIASSMILSMLPGSWLGGFLIEMIGRKWSLVALSPIYVIGWSMISSAGGFASLIIGRLIIGFAIGIGGPLVPVYISEITDSGLRGILLSMVSAGLASGVLLVHAVGLLLHWRTIGYLSIALCIVCSITFIASKESPAWLVNKGDTDRAIESWVYLRGYKSLNEYLALENSVTAERKIDDRSTLSDLKEALTSRHFLYPLVIVCVYFFISQFNGSTVIVFYSVDILTNVTGPDYANVGTLISDLVRLLFSVFACYLINSCKRRTLTFLSGFVTAPTLLLLAAILYYDVGMPWFPGALLLIATLFITIGLEPLPWVLCGELFSRKLRGFGSALTTSCYFLCFFVSVKFLPAMIDALQIYGSFVVYGAITLFGTIFLYYALPETKDKTLQDVERCFDKNVVSTNAVDAEFPGTLHF